MIFHQLNQPYHTSLTAGQLREFIKNLPDDHEITLDGGGDYDDGHTLNFTTDGEPS